MTKIIGITGGIGSGKSTFAKYLIKKGFLVHESDLVVSKIYKEPKEDFIKFLKKNKLKSSIKNKKIDKKMIAEKIFSNFFLKKKLEKYIHKQVSLQRKIFIKKNFKSKKKAVFIDVPLLLENKLEKEFDLVISIISTRKKRTIRVLKKNSFSPLILKKIIKSQTTDIERKKRSDIIIYNNKTKKDFIFGLEKALMQIFK